MHRLLRQFIKEVFQSHHDEPTLGDLIVNVNPSCSHHGSAGIVLRIVSLPDDSGKTAEYECVNDGPTWDRGDILEKTLDQLSYLSQDNSR